jgi:hypothetical protein
VTVLSVVVFKTLTRTIPTKTLNLQSPLFLLGIASYLLSLAIGTRLAFVTLMSSSGASKTCGPRTPAEIEITSNNWAV